MHKGPHISPVDLPPYADWTYGRWAGHELAAQAVVIDRLAELFAPSVSRFDLSGWHTVSAIIANDHCGGLNSYLQSFGGPFDVRSLRAWTSAQWCRLTIYLAVEYLPEFRIRSYRDYPIADITDRSKWGSKSDGVSQQDLWAEMIGDSVESDEKACLIAAGKWCEEVEWLDKPAEQWPRDNREKATEIERFAVLMGNRTRGKTATRRSADRKMHTPHPHPAELELAALIKWGDEDPEDLSFEHERTAETQGRIASLNKIINEYYYQEAAKEAAAHPQTLAMQLLSFINGDVWSKSRWPKARKEWQHRRLTLGYLESVALSLC